MESGSVWNVLTPTDTDNGYSTTLSPNTWLALAMSVIFVAKFVQQRMLSVFTDLGSISKYNFSDG